RFPGVLSPRVQRGEHRLCGDGYERQLRQGVDGVFVAAAEAVLIERRHDDQGNAMIRTTFATRWNLDAIEQAYQRWRNDPASVDDGWRVFFEGFELGAGRAAAPLDSGAQTNIVRLIDAYRDLGHFVAHLDPLSEPRKSHPLLEL